MKSKTRTKNSLLIALVTLVALIVIASLTCPDKGKHTDALSDKVSSIIADETRDDDSGVAQLGMLLGNAVSGAMIKNLVTVDDCFLFSIGKVYSGDEEHVVSVGVFGHVFTASKERIKEEINSFGF